MYRPGHSFIKLFYSCAFQGVHGDFPPEAKTPVLYWFPLLPLSQGRIAGISVDWLQTVLTLPLLVHSFSCPLVSPLTLLFLFGPFPLALSSSWLDSSLFLFSLPPGAGGCCSWEVGQSYCVFRFCGCNSFPSHKNSTIEFSSWILAKWNLVSSENLKTWCSWSLYAYLSFLFKTPRKRDTLVSQWMQNAMLSKLTFCLVI